MCSDYSPYSGQQPEWISRNLQAAAVLSMVTGNRGELGTITCIYHTFTSLHSSMCTCEHTLTLIRMHACCAPACVLSDVEMNEYANMLSLYMCVLCAGKALLKQQNPTAAALVGQLEQKQKNLIQQVHI